MYICTTRRFFRNNFLAPRFAAKSREQNIVLDYVYNSRVWMLSSSLPKRAPSSDACAAPTATWPKKKRRPRVEQRSTDRAVQRMHRTNQHEARQQDVQHSTPKSHHNVTKKRGIGVASVTGYCFNHGPEFTCRGKILRAFTSPDGEVNLCCERRQF